MFAYIARRLGIMVIILLGSSFILYNLAALSGDPLEGLKMSTDPKAKQQIIAVTRELRLDVPPPLRYFMWLRGVLGIFTGNADFGDTRDARAVTGALSDAIPVTVRLVFMATVIAIVLGIAIGITTALRQYSRFDYAMTFVSFLMFSLPIFWVAVLLKQFLAIEFNNFLYEAVISPPWLVALSCASGIFWAAIVSGSRRRVWGVFLGVGAGTAVLLAFLSATKWFQTPSLGPVVILLLGIGVAFGVTQLSMGIANRPALYASLSMAGVGFVAYFPMQRIFKMPNQPMILLGLAALTVVVAVVAGLAFARVDRGPVVRTSVLTAFGVAFLIVVDKLMQVFRPYAETDAVNLRPVPTQGSLNPLLDVPYFWMNLLDGLMHLFLPTVALTLISFAGYVRFSRGTLLEVLNQDYIRTARAKGLPERTVIMRHAFRNTLIPLTTIMVVDFAGIIGGAIITERVFGWRGMGTLFFQGISSFDLNLLMGVFLVTASLAVLANLVADLLYSALDPRIRVGAGK